MVSPEPSGDRPSSIRNGRPGRLLASFLRISGFTTSVEVRFGPRIGPPPRGAIGPKDIGDLRPWARQPPEPLLHPRARRYDPVVFPAPHRDRPCRGWSWRRPAYSALSCWAWNDRGAPGAPEHPFQPPADAWQSRGAGCAGPRAVDACHMLGRRERAVRLAWRQSHDLWLARKRPDLGPRSRQYSRGRSSNPGDSIALRSSSFLPSSTWIGLRLLHLEKSVSRATREPQSLPLCQPPWFTGRN